MERGHESRCRSQGMTRMDYQCDIAVMVWALLLNWPQASFDVMTVYKPYHCHTLINIPHVLRQPYLSLSTYVWTENVKMVSRKEKVFQFYLLSVHCFHLFGCMKKGEIRLAYITASEYRPGTVHKNLPGARVSGAITYAVEQINNDASILPNHNLSFEIAETFGQGLESVRLTSELAVSGRVDAFIGPVFNCSDEARIAAAFNLPMISYVSVVLIAHNSETFICSCWIYCQSDHLPWAWTKFSAQFFHWSNTLCGPHLPD